MDKQDTLAELREALEKFINLKYESVEAFCWDNDLSKSTISNFLNAKKDFQVSTLEKIANAMGKKLRITTL